MSDLPNSHVSETATGNGGSDGSISGGYVPGQTVGEGGRFELVRQLGRGGMGVVWLAKDTRLKDQLTALKFLPPEVRYAPSALADLREETVKARDLTHAHIVRIHDLHETPGETFISMEYVDGPTLSHVRLEEGRRVMSWQRLGPILGQLCDALDYAHSRRKPLIHRDLKPGNIMLDSEGKLKLADFGFARTISDSLSLSLSNNAAQSAGTSGTPAYMSPQQLQGKSARPTDDIYSLGATVYEMLTSKPPFYTGDISYQARSEVPEPMSMRLAEFDLENEIPEIVETVISACLAKDPGSRPQSARQVAELLGLRAAATVPAPAAAQVAISSPSPVPTSSAASRAPALPVTSPAAGARQDIPLSSQFPSEPTIRKAVERQGVPFLVLVSVFGAAGLALAAVGYFAFGPRHGSPEVTSRVDAGTLARGAARIPTAMGGADIDKKEAERQRLANARGNITVETIPSGATVIIAGQDPQTTPAIFKDLKLGETEIRITRDGYEPTTRTLTVKEDETTRLQGLRLANLTGTLKLTSLISASSFEIKGIDGYVKTGTIPADIKDVPVGEATVTFSAPGAPSQTMTARIDTGKEVELLAPFATMSAVTNGGNLAPATGAPGTGTITLTSVPAGVNVLAGGKQIGVTPLTLKDQQPGEYTWEFAKPGFQNTSRTVTVVAGENPPVSVTVVAWQGQPQQQQRNNTTATRSNNATAGKQTASDRSASEKAAAARERNRTINNIVDKLKHVPIPRIRF
ncbi:MAG TPA: protein kinase [Candidatus Methylacidiphilales bacterium]|nr:protein kinase [Candidatus Methylacidiphilales bacterium]